MMLQQQQLWHGGVGVGVGVDNDMYVGKKDFESAGQIPRKQLHMADTINEGRFAVVRKAHLDRGNERSVVAAKALKSACNTHIYLLSKVFSRFQLLD